ncbi:MAG: FMN-dependent NADH-azoreductase [Puniceicoccaceae bacterium 5H]|nr:MAG: FMN-dependent NADH-azoreductase [Puniceicoccaceae bacterium 5H]
MKNLLVIQSSGRVTRSITRQLADCFIQRWRVNHPDAAVTIRDVGLIPPPAVNEAWIAAAFVADTPAAEGPLALSEELIAELEAADVVVIAAPMYNFGLPAQLKAYFDQIVRVGRTFAFDPTQEIPYQPLLEDKPVVALISVGDGAILPGGELAHLNHLEPHLRTILAFIGLHDLSYIRAGYDEYQDGRARRSFERAEAEVDRVVARLALPQPLVTPQPRLRP